MERSIITAFISYSHKDKHYFKILIDGLKAHSNRSKNFEWQFWDDRNIPFGENWHQTIQQHIQDSDFAILLVSIDFLQSEYIGEHELNQFLEKNVKNGFLFFPVLIRDCDFTPIEQLSKIQFFAAYGDDYGMRKKENQIVPYAELVSP